MIDVLTIDIEEPSFIKPVSRNENEMSRFSSYFRKGVLKLTDFIESHNTKDAFFIVDSVADQYPDLIEELDKRGYFLGVHSYEHRDLDTITREDCREEIEKAMNAWKRFSENSNSPPLRKYLHGRINFRRLIYANLRWIQLVN